MLVSGGHRDMVPRSANRPVCEKYRLIMDEVSGNRADSADLETAGISTASHSSEPTGGQQSISGSRAALRLTLAVAVFFLLLGAWSWTNRVEFAAPLGERELTSTDLDELRRIEMHSDLSMTGDEDSHWILSYGFDTPEPDGTWIVANSSRIIFEVEGGRPGRIALTFYPFLSEAISSRDIEVVSSVDAVKASLVDGVTAISVQLDGSSRQAVDIRCARVDSPLDLGVGPDKRTLCAKLLSVRVED